MTPNEAAASNERLTDALHDCTSYAGDVWHQCPCCKEEYSENMHSWENPHTSVRDVWVCSEGCAEAWRNANWDYTPEMEMESRIEKKALAMADLRRRIAEDDGVDFVKVIADEIRKNFLI